MKKFFFFLFIGGSLTAFSQQYNFINYSIEDGLAQSQVRAICQDDDGYIWMGTLGGVSRFDGVKFQNFSTNDGLINNQIYSIYKDSQGKIWVGSLGGVSVYNGLNFQNHEFKEELNKNYVRSITEDHEGNMWFGTDGGGVVLYSDSELTYFNLNNGGGSNYVRNVFCDKENNIWLSTKNGVSIINKGEEYIVSDTLPAVNASQIFIEEDGTVWCSTFGDGVWKINKEGVMKYTVSSGLISNHIRGVVQRKDGTLWFVSKAGISKFDRNHFRNFTTNDGLVNNNIRSVIEDFEENLFFGTDGGGVIKFTNEDFISYSENDGLSSSLIMSMVEDKNQNLWFSTYGKGVSKFDGEEYQHFDVDDGLGNNTVWCSLLDHEGDVWFGTSNGFSVYNEQHFKTYSKEQGLKSKRVYALSEDEEGNIWVGTREGFSVWNRKHDTIANYIEQDEVSRNVRFIYNENQNDIWLCSSDGLLKYNLKQQEIKKYTTQDGLPDNSVMSILKDRNNVLWVGTNNGLAYMDKDRFHPVKLPDNYASNNINFLKLDKYNQLWIGTNYGLYMAYIKEGKSVYKLDFIRFSNLDGLKSLECNQNASFIDKSDNLWFGTSQALMKHPLKKQISNEVKPKVKLVDVRLFFEKQDWAEYFNKQQDSTNVPQNMVLKYNKNHLTFDFIGVCHKSPDKVKYKFKLDGFDEDWQPITTANFVTYSNLPFGEYTFQLSATTDLQNWTEPIRFDFKITPPFWFTWWFYLVSVLFIVTVFWWGINRKRKVETRKKETQSIVDRSKMLVLEHQALNASMNRHFIFNSLNSIQYYINRQDKMSANKYLSSFAKLIRKNLDSSLVTEVYIDEEIERINLYLKLEQMRFQDKFTYKVNFDKSIEPQTIKIPSMLLQPFIENSIWHGILPMNESGHIDINVKKETDRLIIEVVDNGIGIQASLESKKEKKQHHTSKGMSLTKGRIDLMSKMSNRDCFMEGPKQIYDQNNKVSGTFVSIVLSF